MLKQWLKKWGLTVLLSSVGLTAIAVLLVIGMIVAYISGASKDEESVGVGEPIAVGVSSEVLQWELMLREEMRKQQLPEEYLPLVMALIMQESGGHGPDVMQSSESAGLPVNTLRPAESIYYGIKHFKSVLAMAGVKNASDMENIKLMLQSYNFGTGFINYAKQNGGGYTKELAIQFSRLQASKLGWPSYGDIDYVEHVLRYYTVANEIGGLSGGAANPIAKKATEIALQQQGKPYIWGATGPLGFDCSGLVIYAFTMAGHPINGRPTTSTMLSGTAQFKAIQKSQLKVGDLILFKLTSARVSHVGIYLGDGKMVNAETDQAPLGQQIRTVQVFGNSYWEPRIVGYSRVQ